MSQTIKIRYAERVVGSFTLHRRVVARRGGVLQLLPGQSGTGYGGKITTDMVLRFHGEKRERRVYATCYSNSASHWITYDGETLHLQGHYCQSDVLD